MTGQETAEGRAGIAAERDKPFERQATENLPFIGGWLAGKLFGTAGNAAPDSGESAERTQDQRGWGDSSP